MKISSIFVLFLLLTVGGSLHAQQSREIEALKSELVGHCMGGREKCWKFQSIHQIKQLVINKKTDDGKRRVDSITLELEDPRTPGRYKADAQLEYEKVKGEWKVKHVACLSLMKVK